MTDNEIIQALECCFKMESCGYCPLYGPEPDIKECTTTLSGNSLDLINRQKAEIDRLRYILVNFMGEIFDWGNKNGVDTRIFAQTAILGKEKDGAVKQIKSEAYREFADKVEKISKEVTVSYVADTSIQEHKTGMFYYRKEDFDNALNKLLSNDMGRYDHYTDSFVKELTESNE